MWKQRTKTREADIHESVVSHFLFCFGDDIGRWDPNFALTLSKICQNIFNWFETTSCRWMSHETTDPLLTINLSPILNYSPKKSKAHIIKNSLGPNLGHLWSSTWCTSPKNPTTEPFGGGPTDQKHPEMPWVFGPFRSTIDPINPSSTKSVAFLNRLPYLGAQEKLPKNTLRNPNYWFSNSTGLAKFPCFHLGKHPNVAGRWQPCPTQRLRCDSFGDAGG